MTSKRGKIVLLKQKLAEMQNQLYVLQKSEQAKQESKSSRRGPVASPQRGRQFKSPTFWGSNPITHDDTYSPKKYKQSISPTNRSQDKQFIERNSSPVLRNVLNVVDKHYYNSAKQHIEKEVHDINYFYETAYTGKRFENSAFGLTRGSIAKEEKRKIFEKRKTDTILNPEKEKVSCRKIVKIIDKSPEKMLTQNPNSNPNIYFYANRAVMMERKGSMKDKNKSNIVLAHSYSELLPKRPKVRSQKKHFII